MTLLEKVLNVITQMSGARKLNANPNGERYTYLGNPEIVKKQKIQEFKVWYYGDSNELLNYYTAMSTYGNCENPIYNRNRAQYFWGINPQEIVKRVHSGIPYAIVSTMVSIIGSSIIESTENNELLQEIITKNNLHHILDQQQKPLTLALGWGALKPIFDKKVSDVPLVEYYEADDVDFAIKHGIITGIIFKDYYHYKNRDYVLIETRRVFNGDSLIEYQLNRLEKDNETTEVPLDTIPELAELSTFIVKGYSKPLAVPTIYFYDMYNKGYGRSIYEGKIGLFDDLDQSLSQRSKTCRVSTPVEYIPVDMLERGRNGQTTIPDVYNRQYIKNEIYPSGDGDGVKGQIQTTQPILNFDQYSQEQKEIIGMILTGYMSPASFGLDLAKKDNADAQREKEKVTIMTRDNIISSQTKIEKDLCQILLMFAEYMRTGTITLKDYDISVKFSEFANPSFESLSQTLYPMWVSGAISTEMYVTKLYGDSLSEEEKQKEIQALETNKQRDTIDTGAFEYENGITENSYSERTNENPVE